MTDEMLTKVNYQKAVTENLRVLCEIIGIRRTENGIRI